LFDICHACGIGQAGKGAICCGAIVRRFEDWNAKETEFLNETQLITSKPVVYLLNLSEKNYVAKKGKWLKPVFEWVQVRDLLISST
jgi:ribosome-binding ATPase YchF (GTP1/OBG family)